MYAHKMRDLYGVIFAGAGFSTNSLKKNALLFDKFLIPNLTPFLGQCTQQDRTRILQDLQYLRDRETAYEIRRLVERSPVMIMQDAPQGVHSNLITIGEDLETRITAVLLSGIEADIVPICKNLPEHLSLPLPDIPELTAHQIAHEQHDVIRVATHTLPAPDESCAWQDILDFKAEQHDKLWAFRRWLHSLSTKQLTEAEIRDELDWSMNEYRKAMEIHHIKASQSFVDVFVITPLEIIENLVKFNWSKIAKGALQVRKRKIGLLEAEMKAPGRECSYVFDARKRFGTK
jgi:hypothetical protein